MPKLKNVTPAEWQEALSKADDAMFALLDVLDRLEKGYADDLPDMLGAARSLNALAMTATKGVSHSLMKEGLQAQKREIQAMLRQKEQQ